MWFLVIKPNRRVLNKISISKANKQENNKKDRDNDIKELLSCFNTLIALFYPFIVL